jgi:hypothetical protein
VSPNRRRASQNWTASAAATSGQPPEPVIARAPSPFAASARLAADIDTALMQRVFDVPQ